MPTLPAVVSRARPYADGSKRIRRRECSSSATHTGSGTVETGRCNMHRTRCGQHAAQAKAIRSLRPASCCPTRVACSYQTTAEFVAASAAVGMCIVATDCDDSDDGGALAEQPAEPLTRCGMLHVACCILRVMLHVACCAFHVRACMLHVACCVVRAQLQLRSQAVRTV